MDRKQRSQILTGAVLITVGLVFFLGQIDSDWHYALRISRLWPVILLVIGAGRIVLPEGDPAKGEARSSGVWLIAVRTLFLLNNYRADPRQDVAAVHRARRIVDIFSREKPARAAASAGEGRPANGEARRLFRFGRKIVAAITAWGCC